jgi:uncharacterized radical SAM superfamily Fe-S cluster-containing enzyme
MSTPAFAAEMAAKFKIVQPQTTYTGSSIQPIQKGLPKATESLCPECSQVIKAWLFEEGGRVIMEKFCTEHGEFRDTVSSDVKIYLKMEEWTFGDNRGVSNPSITGAVKCPESCGLCNLHTSHTGLANIDLTNRCNLTCPVCFANANVQGYLYEPELEHIGRMLQTLRKTEPVAGRVVQFSGGEPTLHPRFFDILKMAKGMGFTHLQIATNGLTFESLQFAQRAKESGLHTLYLQFDGVTDDVYRRTRGERLFERKVKCIENVRKAGLKIVFVPTIVKGVNDHEIGAILRMALDNIDCVSGISFQPVAFTGRIAKHELESKRFTLADFAHAVYDQTGMADPYKDWFPLACVSPFSKLLSALRGEETTTLTCHPHCSLGTYFFVDHERNAVPVTRFVDIGGMLQDMDNLARKAGKAWLKVFPKMQAWHSLRRHFHQDRAPKGLTFDKFLQTLQGLVDKKYGRGSGDGSFTYKTLMVAGMHFMDHYNYDVERVKRCVIHYAAPNGQLYPFCAYNSGPTFRDRIEREYSTDLPEGMRLNQVKNGCSGC